MKRNALLIVDIVIIPVVLFVLFYLHIYPQFRGGFTQQLSSIEVSYISMGEFILKDSPKLSWQPLWYLGYPYYLIYLPLVPYVEALGSHLLGYSPASIYRVVTAFSYAFVPVAVYLLIRFITANRLAGIISSLGYGIIPSTLAYFFTDILQDRMSIFAEPRRFAVLTRWGEGPHTVALVFVPLAGLFFYRFLKRGRFWDRVLAAIFAGLVALTNAVGLWGLLTLLLSITVEIFVVGAASIKVLVKRLITWVLLFGGLIFFWYHPAFVLEFYSEGGGNLTYWSSFFPWGFIGIILGAWLYIFLLKKFLRKSCGLVLSLTWFLLMFSFVYIYYASGEERVELVPQVLRLNTEVDMAFALLLGSLYALLYKWVFLRGAILRIAGSILGILLIVPLLYYNRHFIAEFPRFVISLEESGKNISEVGDYAVAMNLKKLVKEGERVFVPGNYSFFLNYFSDIPQLRGGLFQSSIHPWPDHIYYQVTNGASSEISLAWLKIANIAYLVYTTSASSEPFKDYKVPQDKFAKVLKEVMLSEGNIYYQVPLSDSSLAKVVSRDILALRVPTNAIDKEPIFAYAQILEKSPGKAKIIFADNRAYEITANVGKDEVVLVQSAYHQGWRAVDNQGTKLPVLKDPLGFIIIKPLTTGILDIKLTHGSVISEHFGRVVTMVTVAGIIYLGLRKRAS